MDPFELRYKRIQDQSQTADIDIAFHFALMVVLTSPSVDVHSQTAQCQMVDLPSK